MTGPRHTVPAPELPDEPRHALIVSTTAYRDGALRKLRAPARDATDLADVLADDRIGGFNVTQVLDTTAHEIRVALESFLTDRRPADLVLIYLSCHGLVDGRRRLYFAGADTVKNRLAATGVESRWVLEQMEECRARRQILILDCCFSGAFALNAKGENDLEIGNRFSGDSRGRVVLTASRATEYSFEGEPVADAPSGSVFTSALLKGIRTGAADINNDGYIGVEEAYEYAFNQVRAAGADQTPQRYVDGGEGASIVLARSPAGMTIGAASLPEALKDALQNPFIEVRIGAVRALGEWLRSPDPTRVLAARQALHPIADTENPHVAEVARGLLDAEQESRRRPRPTPESRVRPPRRVLGEPELASADSTSVESTADDRPGPAASDFDETLEGLGYQSRGLPLRPVRFVSQEDEPSGIVARYLFPTEKFRGEWRQHWVSNIKRTLYAAAAITVGITQPGIGYLPAEIDKSMVRIGIQVVMGTVALYLLWRNVTWYFDRFVITNKRIMQVTGLFTRRVAMMPLQRVTDMKYHQTWLARLFNYGTFEIEGAGRMSRLRRIRNLPNPNELYLRVIEEMYEPEAVEARLAYSADYYEPDDDGPADDRPDRDA
jgi:hypothetical protein